MLFKKLRLTECQAIINEASISLLFSKYPGCSVLLSLSWLLLKMKMSPRKEHAQNVLNKRFWNIWPVRNRDFKGWQSSDYKQETLNIRHKKILLFGVILHFEHNHVLIKTGNIKEKIYNKYNSPHFQFPLPRSIFFPIALISLQNTVSFTCQLSLLLIVYLSLLDHITSTKAEDFFKKSFAYWYPLSSIQKGPIKFV